MRHSAGAWSPKHPNRTWGATDLTWSPDGSKFAFSLFGSIWQVAAEGGQAGQISASGGYHAHPAWSPKGDKIAFVRGDPPGNSSSPSIQGDLMLVDVTSGEEQQIHTPARVSGTLAWSPDGTKIACALLIPSQDGALIHEVDVASGAVRQLQLPRAFAKARLGSTWHGIRNRTRFFSRRSGAGRRKYARCRRETRP